MSKHVASYYRTVLPTYINQHFSIFLAHRDAFHQFKTSAHLEDLDVDGKRKLTRQARCMYSVTLSCFRGTSVAVGKQQVLHKSDVWLTVHRNSVWI